MSLSHLCRLLIASGLVLGVGACGGESTEPAPPSAADNAAPAAAEMPAAVAARPDVYAEFTLASDLSALTENQRAMLVLLFEASQIMDDLFWRQAFGDGYEAWLDTIGVAAERRFAELNYGPWDRLDDEKPFLAGFGDKPLGAQFYPADMSIAEFEAADLDGKNGLYSFVRRDEAGALTLVPYHVEFATELAAAADLLRQAADLAEHEGFAGYLALRADALVSGEFLDSDMAWMDVKDNPVELVIGPIETYEDRLFGYRTAYESYVLIKRSRVERRN